MADDQHRRALAEEIRQSVARITASRTALGVSGGHISALGFLVHRHADTILAALSGREVEAMRADDHRIKALIAEARERAFRRDLAERTCQSERERWLRVGKKALAGDLRALARQIAVTENPPRIVGSGAAGPALPQEGRSDG